jgi:hypothetical protein
MFQKGELSLSISVGPVGQGKSPSLNNNEDIEAQLIPAGRLSPFLMVTSLFFLWAIPNNLNDILIRQFMESFNINRSSAAGVQIWFYLGYFLLAIPALPAGQRVHLVLSGGAGGAVRSLCHRKTPMAPAICQSPLTLAKQPPSVPPVPRGKSSLNG